MDFDCFFGLQVNQAVDSMSDERQRIEGELEQAKLEIQTLTQNKHQLEQETARLLDRIGDMEQTQVSVGTVSL